MTAPSASMAPAAQPAGKSGRGQKSDCCARCGSTEPWGMASWCPACGYYPIAETAEEDRMAWRKEAAAPGSDEEGGEEQGLFSSLPAWMWISLFGIAGIFLSSIAARKHFEKAEDFRSPIAWTQLIVGFCVAFVAHAVAAWIARKSDHRMTFSDTLLNWMAVWQPTIATLPRGAVRVWAFLWGLTAVACSLFIIRGHDTSMFFKQDPEDAPSVLPDVVGTVASAAKANAKKADSLEDALKEIGDPEEMLEGLSPAEVGQAEEEAARSVLICAIFGVKVDRQGTPTQYLLCGRSREKLQYVATIRAESLDSSTQRLIARRLNRTNQSTPAVPTPISAVWVQPKIACRVEYESVTETGTLAKAKVTRVESSDWSSSELKADTETPPETPMEFKAPGSGSAKKKKKMF